MSHFAKCSTGFIFKNKCFLVSWDSICLISNQHTKGSADQTVMFGVLYSPATCDLCAGQNSAQISTNLWMWSEKAYQTHFNLLWRIMMNIVGCYVEWTPPSGHILSYFHLLEPSPAHCELIISPVTELCSPKISYNGCVRINRNWKLLRGTQN